MQRESALNYGTMTQEEKRINKSNLHNYKANDHQIIAMIPGIYNIPSVGTSPTLRGRATLVTEGDELQKKLDANDKVIIKSN